MIAVEITAEDIAHQIIHMVAQQTLHMVVIPQVILMVVRIVMADHIVESRIDLF